MYTFCGSLNLWPHFSGLWPSPDVATSSYFKMGFIPALLLLSVCLFILSVSSSLWSKYHLSLMTPWCFISSFSLLGPFTYFKQLMLCMHEVCAYQFEDTCLRVLPLWRRVIIRIWTCSENSECSRRELHTEDQSSFLFLSTPLRPFPSITLCVFINPPSPSASLFSLCPKMETWILVLMSLFLLI